MKFLYSAQIVPDLTFVEEIYPRTSFTVKILRISDSFDTMKRYIEYYKNVFC